MFAPSWQRRGERKGEKNASVYKRIASLPSVCLEYEDNSCSFSLSLMKCTFQSLLLATGAAGGWLLQLPLFLGTDRVSVCPCWGRAGQARAQPCSAHPRGEGHRELLAQMGISPPALEPRKGNWLLFERMWISYLRGEFPVAVFHIYLVIDYKVWIYIKIICEDCLSRFL